MICKLIRKDHKAITQQCGVNICQKTPIPLLHFALNDAKSQINFLSPSPLILKDLLFRVYKFSNDYSRREDPLNKRTNTDTITSAYGKRPDFPTFLIILQQFTIFSVYQNKFSLSNDRLLIVVFRENIVCLPGAEDEVATILEQQLLSGGALGSRNSSHRTSLVASLESLKVAVKATPAETAETEPKNDEEEVNDSEIANLCRTEEDSSVICIDADAQKNGGDLNLADDDDNCQAKTTTLTETLDFTADELEIKSLGASAEDELSPEVVVDSETALAEGSVCSVVLPVEEVLEKESLTVVESNEDVSVSNPQIISAKSKENEDSPPGEEKVGEDGVKSDDNQQSNPPDQQLEESEKCRKVNVGVNDEEAAIVTQLDDRKSANDCSGNLLTTIANYYSDEQDKTNNPTVPPKTYKWEDIRRLKQQVRVLLFVCWQ